LRQDRHGSFLPHAETATGPHRASNLQSRLRGSALSRSMRTFPGRVARWPKARRRTRSRRTPRSRTTPSHASVWWSSSTRTWRASTRRSSRTSSTARCSKARRTWRSPPSSRSTPRRSCSTR